MQNEVILGAIHVGESNRSRNVFLEVEQTKKSLVRKSAELLIWCLIFVTVMIVGCVEIVIFMQYPITILLLAFFFMAFSLLCFEI